MCKKNETGFQNTLEFPKNDFKERSPELLKKNKSKKGTLRTKVKLVWRNSHENDF